MYVLKVDGGGYLTYGGDVSSRLEGAALYSTAFTAFSALDGLDQSLRDHVEVVRLAELLS